MQATFVQPELNYLQLEMICKQLLNKEEVTFADIHMTGQVWNYARTYYQMNLTMKGNTLRKN